MGFDGEVVVGQGPQSGLEGGGAVVGHGREGGLDGPDTPTDRAGHYHRQAQSHGGRDQEDDYDDQPALFEGGLGVGVNGGGVGTCGILQPVERVDCLAEDRVG